MPKHARRGARASFARNALPPVTAGLAGSFLALLVVALAPGNEVRQSFFTPPPDLLAPAKISLYYATGHVPYTVYLSPFTTLLTPAVLALTGFYLYATDPARREALDLGKARRLLTLLPAVGYVLILLCYVPAAYTVTAVADVETRFGAGKTELRIERDPEDWKNKCVARFYGINSVRAR